MQQYLRRLRQGQGYVSEDVESGRYLVACLAVQSALELPIEHEQDEGPLSSERVRP